MAAKFMLKTEGELAAGTYQIGSRKSWPQFRDEYKDKVCCLMEPGTRRETISAIEHFERLVKPQRLSAIKSQTIASFVAKRSVEPSRRRKGLRVSPATVNKELRHIKSVLGTANDWGYLPQKPKVKMLREPEKMPLYVTAEHFAAIYKACEYATRPGTMRYAAADWWRALMVFTYMTGWRISEPLALQRDDLDLEAAFAITRHEDNKGRRDDRVPLHGVVVEHLRAIVGFDPVVFPWPHHRRTLDVEFQKIQLAAGIHLKCREASNTDHECTTSCHL